MGPLKKKRRAAPEGAPEGAAAPSAPLKKRRKAAAAKASASGSKDAGAAEPPVAGTEAVATPVAPRKKLRKAIAAKAKAAPSAAAASAAAAPPAKKKLRKAVAAKAKAPAAAKAKAAAKAPAPAAKAPATGAMAAAIAKASAPAGEEARRRFLLAAERFVSRGPARREPVGECRAALIWLHGPGSSPESWSERLAPVWRGLGKSWLFLHLRAPRLKLSCAAGQRLEAWADILSTDCVRPGSPDYESPDTAGHYAATAASVHSALEELEVLQGIPAARVVVGGFSQGAACALQAALRHKKRIAGCVALSGWLPPAAREALAAGAHGGLPVLLGHGKEDDKVGAECSVAAKAALEGAGAEVEHHEIAGLGHGVSQKELLLLRKFLSRCLDAPGAAPAGAPP